MPINPHLLKDNLDLVRASEAKRLKHEPGLADKAAAWYRIWVQNKNLLDELRKEKNDISKLVGQKKKNKENADAEMELSKTKSNEIVVMEQVVAHMEEQMKAEVNKIGNIVHESVPVSLDEANNEVVGTFETARHYPEGLKIQSHHVLLYRIGGFEPERGVKCAGHRAYYLTNAGATLSQALAMYGMEFLEKQGYGRVIPPYFMSKTEMGKVAELDDFNEQLYHVSQFNGSEDQSKYLIATSEQPLCAFHEDEIINPKDFPIKYAGFSTCFRKEAGKHGKDTWGIYRVHQFDKVEQFVLCDPEKSWEMHEEMRQVSENFLRSLMLPYRVVNIVSGELNNAAAKKYDIEGYFPGYGEYKELVSCSNCLDYQSRALGIRFGKAQYVHMLNATLCAIPRTICAILENYQQADGVRVPEVLQRYVGKDFLPFVRDELPQMTNAQK